jgi:hypothetical protein
MGAPDRELRSLRKWHRRIPLAHGYFVVERRAITNHGAAFLEQER